MRRVAVLFCVALGACNPQADRERPDRAVVRQTLDSTLREHARLIVAEDVDGIVAQYTPDAVVRSNHTEPLRGRDAIRAFIAGMLASGTFDNVEYETESLAVYGDSAWHIVTYRVGGRVGNQSVADSGSAFVLWTRENGGAWRIKDDILNSRIPLTASPTASR